MNLTKEVKDLYSEKYRALMKEVEEDTKKWKNILCPRIGGTNIVKISTLPKEIYTFNAIPIKIPSTFFRELEYTICLEPERPPRANRMLKKRTKTGGITGPDFKLHFKAVITKTVWYSHKTRHLDQWSRIEDPGMAPQLYGHLIFDKGGKNSQWKKTVSSTNGVGKIGQPHAEE